MEKLHLSLLISVLATLLFLLSFDFNASAQLTPMSEYGDTGPIEGPPTINRNDLQAICIWPDCSVGVEESAGSAAGREILFNIGVINAEVVSKDEYAKEISCRANGEYMPPVGERIGPQPWVYARSQYHGVIPMIKVEGDFPIGTSDVKCYVRFTEYIRDTSQGDTYESFKNAYYISHSGLLHFTVQIKDTTPPIITTPETIEYFTILKSMPINYSGFLSASDDISKVDLSCNPPSGSLFNVGVTDVTCTAKDAYGNENTKTFKVDIQALTKGDPSPSCRRMEVKNITTNEFENDPPDYHPPDHAVDGNSSTWWSNNQGKNSWLRIDLGNNTALCEVLVQWNKGDTREYTFEISASENGNDFKRIFEGTNEKGSSSAEYYQIDGSNGRYLMLTVTGSSSNQGWVSIEEIGVYGGPVL